MRKRKKGKEFSTNPEEITKETLKTLNSVGAAMYNLYEKETDPDNKREIRKSIIANRRYVSEITTPKPKPKTFEELLDYAIRLNIEIIEDLKEDLDNPLFLKHKKRLKRMIKHYEEELEELRREYT